MSESILISDQPEARNIVLEHVSHIEADPSFGEPSEAMMRDHDTTMDDMMAIAHQTNRGKNELAGAFDMRPGRFVSLFAGKNVLDVGCGVGVFDGQLAENRRTRITAMELNRLTLARVPNRPNIRKVLGSGYDIQKTLGDEEFDLVVVAFSSLTWARTAEQARASIDSAIRACRIGGAALFIPIIQHPQSYVANNRALVEDTIPGYASEEVTPADIKRNLNSAQVEGWLRSTKVRTLEAAEVSGAIACSFVAGAVNKKGLPVHPSLGPEHPYEDYSVAATILEK